MAGDELPLEPGDIDTADSAQDFSVGVAPAPDLTHEVFTQIHDGDTLVDLKMQHHVTSGAKIPRLLYHLGGWKGVGNGRSRNKPIFDLPGAAGKEQGRVDGRNTVR